MGVEESRGAGLVLTSRGAKRSDAARSSSVCKPRYLLLSVLVMFASRRRIALLFKQVAPLQCINNTSNVTARYTISGVVSKVSML